MCLVLKISLKESGQQKFLFFICTTTKMYLRKTLLVTTFKYLMYKKLVVALRLTHNRRYYSGVF